MEVGDASISPFLTFPLPPPLLISPWPTNSPKICMLLQIWQTTRTNSSQSTSSITRYGGRQCFILCSTLHRRHRRCTNPIMAHKFILDLPVASNFASVTHKSAMDNMRYHQEWEVGARISPFLTLPPSPPLLTFCHGPQIFPKYDGCLKFGQRRAQICHHQTNNVTCNGGMEQKVRISPFCYLPIIAATTNLATTHICHHKKTIALARGEGKRQRFMGHPSFQKAVASGEDVTEEGLGLVKSSSVFAMAMEAKVILLSGLRSNTFVALIGSHGKMIVCSCTILPKSYYPLLHFCPPLMRFDMNFGYTLRLHNFPKEVCKSNVSKILNFPKSFLS